MNQQEIRIGIVGANNKEGWAKDSHIPAINGLPGLKLAAVATRNEQSAREAAEVFGTDRWFSDPFAMIRDERIDVITIAVKVPAHRELVLAALNAGKAVYCEAPLGRTVTEAEEMARAASSLHTAIGLQGRHNPAARRAAELVSSGRIGQPLNARIVSPTFGFGPEMPIAHDLFNKSSSGANLLTITGGHTLDLVETVLSPIVEVDARTEIRWPIVKLTETGSNSVRETADYVGVVGKTRSGAAFTAEIEAGVPPQNVRFSLEVTAMENFANDGGMISEQLWDADDLPDGKMKRGCPTGAAMPLCWSHAEYVSLVRSRHDGVCFDRVESAFERYVANPVQSRYEIWTLRHPLRRMSHGKILRIILAAEAMVVWSTDDWSTTNESAMTHQNELNLWFSDFPTADWSANTMLALHCSGKPTSAGKATTGT